MDTKSSQGERAPSWLVWIALIVTAAWLALTLLLPTIHQGIGPLAAWREPVQGYFGGETTLGETGDFLTGWLTPLALMWFVITVFLQMRELALQRQEFVAMRREWEGSKEAAERQAEQLAQSNNVRERQLFREVLLDTIKMMPRICDHVVDAYNVLCQDIKNNGSIGKSFGGQISSDDLMRSVRTSFHDFIVHGANPNNLSIDKLVEMKQCERKGQLIYRIIELADRLESLRSRASTLDCMDEFHAFCSWRIEGEIMVLAERLIAKVEQLAQQKNAA